MQESNAPPGSFVLTGGRVIDPAVRLDRIADVSVIDGFVASIGDAPRTGLPIIDTTGLIVCPGLIDIHVHLREPGGEHKETIESGTRAAAAGGFTAVACMPNTNPVTDHVDAVEAVLRRAAEVGAARVYPIGAITLGRHGDTVVDFRALKSAGAVAFSDDGDGVESDDVMREAMLRAKEVGVVLIQHCEYKAISAGGVMHRGAVSTELGLPGLDPRSEEDMIARDIELSRETGARYHVAHISTARAVQMVRNAKAEGIPVTAEVCPHHCLLTDDACSEQDPNTKMHPPLRTRADIDACLEGLVDGTIDCIVTDHAPHATEEKARGFLRAPPGIVGLETSLGLSAQALILPGKMDWLQLIDHMSTKPASLLGVPGGSLATGAAADITLIDPGATWRIEPNDFCSKGRNTPFGGWEVTGRCVATILGGRWVYRLEAPGSRFSEAGFGR